MQHVPQKAHHGHLLHLRRERPPRRRPQEPTGDGAGWSFRRAEDAGKYPDT